MLSPVEQAWCDYLRTHRPETPVNGLRHPEGGDLCDATSSRPRMDDSPDLDQRTPAEAEIAWGLHSSGVAEPDDEQEPR